MIEAKAASPDALAAILDDLNERGACPDVAGLDTAGVPFIAWLVGDADIARMCVATLGGEDGERPELRSVELHELRYPVAVVATGPGGN